jgi:hypothetical protein
MVVTGRVVMSGDSYIHTLQKDCVSFSDLRTSGLTVGEYVTVTSDDQLAVATGTVCDITESILSLSLNRSVLLTRIPAFVANISGFRCILLQKLREQLAIYVMNLMRVNLKDPNLLTVIQFHMHGGYTVSVLLCSDVVMLLCVCVCVCVCVYVCVTPRLTYCLLDCSP